MRYLVDYITHKRPASVETWVDSKTYGAVTRAVEEMSTRALRPLYEKLDEEIPYDEIRVVLAHLETLAYED